MSTVLVVNSGSSSFKYQLIEMATERVVAKGLVERIGEPVGVIKHQNLLSGVEYDEELPIPDHAVGFDTMFQAFRHYGPEHSGLIAVGHRVVHGGATFVDPVVITDEVAAEIEALSVLAPLHNPGAVQGIRAAQHAYPDVPHVAVFDTAYHQTLPPAAYRYAIDRELADAHQVRRYGFHGTSHAFVAAAAAEFLGKDLSELNAIIFHLGNGASVTAVRAGKSVDTSMGMTPLQGLVMGTRSGDIDPAVLFHLHREAGLDVVGLDTLLNKRSGLVGLTGTGDFRDVLLAAAEGSANAAEAIDIVVHRLRHYLGAYFFQLERVDAIVFTAGVGENNALIRARTLAGLERLGIEVDPARNESSERGARRISSDNAEVAALVVPTNEELAIARQAASLVAAAD